MNSQVSTIKIIGHNYETPTIINLANGRFICKKGGKIWTNVDAYDAYALHIGKMVSPIPKGTELVINYCFQNFYGVYVNCTYNNYDYDLNSDDLIYLNKTLTQT